MAYCRYNVVNFLQNSSDRYPITRPWGTKFEVSVVSLKSVLRSVAVIAIGPRDNNIRLHIKRAVLIKYGPVNFTNR